LKVNYVVVPKHTFCSLTLPITYRIFASGFFCRSRFIAFRKLTPDLMCEDRARKKTVAKKNMIEAMTMVMNLE